MYVRWKARQNRTGESWYVYLCTNERIEGKPQSTTLGYLGSIRADLAPFTPVREAFWQQVKENLESHHLPKHKRQEIESDIASRVPKSKAQWADWYDYSTNLRHGESSITTSQTAISVQNTTSH